jgi:hypothetical protein
MPAWMMQTSTAVARLSAVLVVGTSLGACELAKRDFDDTVSSETSGEGGSSGGAQGTVSGETAVTTDGEITVGPDTSEEGQGNTNGPQPEDSSVTSITSTNSSNTNGVPNQSSDAPPGDSTSASGATEPEPGDTSSVEQGTSVGEQTTAPRCDENILVNGNFEAGEEGWTPSSSYTAFEQRVHPLIVANGHESLTNYAVTAHDGTQFAFLGDVPDDEHDKFHTTLTQPIFVPQEAVGLALVGHVWVSTNEPDDQAWDLAYIQLESQENSEDYWQFKYWSNLDASDGWVKFDAYLDVVDAFRGKYVNLLVQAVTDQSTATRFWFDELEVVVVCSY